MEQYQDILVGRDAEKKHLESIVLSKEAEFVVVYGRRRVGKTFLVNTFFDDKYAFKLTGLAQKSKREQLANFAVSLNRYGGGAKYKKPRTWYEAFDMLRQLLEKATVKGKRVVFIDELPWKRSGTPAAGAPSLAQHSEGNSSVSFSWFPSLARHIPPSNTSAFRCL